MTFGLYKDKYWTCSVERLDNAIGYTRSNICLIVFELNTARQWSREKLAYMLSFHKDAVLL